MDSYRSKKFERKSRFKCVKNILFLITVITICSKSWQALFVNILLQPLWTTCPFASHEHSCILIDIAISKTLYFVKLPVTKTSWLISTWGFFWRQKHELHERLRLPLESTALWIKCRSCWCAVWIALSRFVG